MSILERFQFHRMYPKNANVRSAIALFPGLPQLQALIICHITQQWVSSSTGAPQAVWIDWVECQVPLRWTLPLPADLWSLLLCSEGTTHDHASYVMYVSSGIATPEHGLVSFFYAHYKWSIRRIWLGAVIPWKWQPIWCFSCQFWAVWRQHNLLSSVMASMIPTLFIFYCKLNQCIALLSLIVRVKLFDGKEATKLWTLRLSTSGKFAAQTLISKAFYFRSSS